MTCYYYCAYWERLRRETELPRLAQGAADDGGTAGLGCGSVGSSVPSMPEALGSTPALHNPSIVAPGVIPVLGRGRRTRGSRSSRTEFEPIIIPCLKKRKEETEIEKQKNGIR